MTPLRSRKTSLGLDLSGGGTYAYYPFLSLPKTIPHTLDLFEGQHHVGALQRQTADRGGRRFFLGGIQSQLRGQPSSGTDIPEAPFLYAAGFDRSGSTGYTYFLADYHLETEAVAGNCLPIPGCRYVIDGDAWDGVDLVSELSFDFQANRHPIMSIDLYGNIPTSLGVNTSGHQTGITFPSSVANGTLRSAPFLNSTVSVGGQALVLQRCIYKVGNMIENDRQGAGAKHGYQQNVIADRFSTGRILVESPAQGSFDPEDKALSNSDVAVSFTYRAGGSTGDWGLFTVTFTCKYRGGVNIGERNGLIQSVVDFQQKESSGGLSLAITQL